MLALIIKDLRYRVEFFVTYYFISTMVYGLWILWHISSDFDFIVFSLCASQFGLITPFKSSR